MTRTVGFIGLGDMGLPMAKRVLGGGYELTVCGHRRRQPVEEIKALGAKEVASPDEVAASTEVTIVMLPDDTATEGVVFGLHGILKGASQGSGIILMGTVSPDFCRRAGKDGKAKNIRVLDAPVTGARMRAETGDLGIMAGGDKTMVEEYRPILQTMGKVIYCGQLGSGQIVKLANNMILQVNIHAAYEAISWGIKNDADEEFLVEVLKMGTANSWVMQNWGFVKSMNTDPPSPHHILGAKDLDYALKIGHEHEQPCPLVAICRERAAAGGLKLPEQPRG